MSVAKVGARGPLSYAKCVKLSVHRILFEWPQWLRRAAWQFVNGEEGGGCALPPNCRSEGLLDVTSPFKFAYTNSLSTHIRLIPAVV